MTQIVSSFNKLTPTQCETCLKNFAKIRHFEKIELIFDGKPSNNPETKKEVEKLGLEPIPVTKFANNYKIYKLSDVRESENVETIRKYNKDCKIKNLNDRVEIIIVVDIDKIDRQNYLALIYLYPMFHNILKTNKDYKMLYGGEIEEDKPTEKIKAEYIKSYKYMYGPCYVTILTTNHIESNMIKHFHIRFLPCNYRVMSMYDDLYPLIGSKNTLWCGSTINFEVMKYEKLYNNYNYSVIYDDEHLVKILNANPGDLIIGQQVLFEGRPYLEFVIKEVKTRTHDEDEEEDEN